MQKYKNIHDLTKQLILVPCFQTNVHDIIVEYFKQQKRSLGHNRTIPLFSIGVAMFPIPRLILPDASDGLFIARWHYQSRPSRHLRCHYYWCQCRCIIDVFHDDINSLWPRDAIWRQMSGSTLAQVMACCLTAPSHYLIRCWLIISEVLLHSSLGIITRRTEDTNQ